MEEISSAILFLLIVFIGVFIIDYFLILRNRLFIILNRKINKKNKDMEIGEINYLAYKFKIPKQDLYKVSIILWIAFVNAFIISLVSTVVTSVPLAICWQLLIGFALLWGLIYSLYEIFGRVLIKKGY